MFGKVLMISIAALVVWGVVVRASNGAGPERVYVVHPHDTLWTIAAKTYGGDPRAGVWKIEKANHLVGATIVPGQQLHIPG
jgi:nucleoid-associated protein YgaU